MRGLCDFYGCKIQKLLRAGAAVSVVCADIPRSAAQLVEMCFPRPAAEALRSEGLQIVVMHPHSE